MQRKLRMNKFSNILLTIVQVIASILLGLISVAITPVAIVGITLMSPFFNKFYKAYVIWFTLVIELFMMQLVGERN